jgi:hypothetical protein
MFVFISGKIKIFPYKNLNEYINKNYTIYCDM